MGLIDAHKFLRGAVRGQPSYGFDEGRMYARGPALLASYPVPHMLGTFAVAQEELDSALSRMPSEPVVSGGDGAIVLRSGRLRSTIDLLDYASPGNAPAPDDAWPEPPAGLLAALGRALPFVSDSGTWNRSVKLETGRVLAMSGFSAVAVDVPGLEVEGHLALTDEVAEYLSKLPPPARWLVDASSVSFSWASGAWVRCQSTALPWPDGVFDRALGMGVADGDPVAISDAFREAFADVVALVDGNGVVVVDPEGMRGKSEHAEHVVAVPTGVAGESQWAIRALRPVVPVARRFWPRADGPSRFEADDARGVVMPRREGR